MGMAASAGTGSQLPRWAFVFCIRLSRVHKAKLCPCDSGCENASLGSPAALPRTGPSTSAGEHEGQRCSLPCAMCNGPAGLANSHGRGGGWGRDLCPELNSAPVGSSMELDGIDSSRIYLPSLPLPRSSLPSSLPPSLFVSCKNKRIKNLIETSN